MAPINPILFVLVAVAGVALFEAAFHGVRFVLQHKDDELRRRLRAVGRIDAGVQLLKRRRLAASQFFDDLLGGLNTSQRIAQMLDQTDLGWTVGAFFTTSAICGGLTLIVFAGLLRLGLLGVLMGIAASFGPLFLVQRARGRRSKLISEQLPDALEMMSRSIRAGHALPVSFSLVAQEMSPPIAVEFGKAYEQQNLGIPFEQSVVNMTERVPDNTDLSIFAVSVLIQRETGGNLVELLEKIATTIRNRDHFYGKLRALTAEARLGGYILSGLPIVVALLLLVVNPGYVKELNTGLGRIILGFGLALWSAGIVWMYKLSQVDY